jgi:hypothetical protein
MNLRHAVERGIEILDVAAPGWEQRIALDDLDMQSCNNCMLGLLFGRFSEGKDALGIKLGQTYGFALPRGLKTAHESRQAWKELRRLWIEEIETRRFNAELEDVTSGRALVAV